MEKSPNQIVKRVKKLLKDPCNWLSLEFQIINLHKSCVLSQKES
jgi:hypothetical protein